MDKEAIKRNNELAKKIQSGNKTCRQREIEGFGTVEFRSYTVDDIYHLQEMEKPDQKAKLKIEKKGKSREQIRDEVEDQLQNFETDVDVKTMVRKEKETRMEAVYLSTGITKDLLKEMPKKVFDDLFEVATEELEDEDLDTVKQFRKDRNRETDR